MAQFSEPIDTSTWTLRGALAPSVAAIKSRWQPMLLIQALAAAFVVVFYRSPAVQAGAHVLAAWKVAGGLAFAFLAGTIAGGLVPEAAKVLTGKVRRFDRRWAGKLAFVAATYGILAVLCDLLYRTQTLLFSSGVGAGTVAIKVAVDQLVFTPLVSLPFSVGMFAWRRNAFRVRPMLRWMRLRTYRDEVVPALFLCWAFWGPVLCCVYSMPADLQFCFARFADAAWSIAFVFLATGSEER